MEKQAEQEEEKEKQIEQEEKEKQVKEKEIKDKSDDEEERDSERDEDNEKTSAVQVSRCFFLELLQIFIVFLVQLGKLLNTHSHACIEKIHEKANNLMQIEYI